jgi:hypothetical protein
MPGRTKTKKAGPWWSVYVGGSWGIVEAGSEEQAINDALCGVLGFDAPTLRTQLEVKPYLREGVRAHIASEEELRRYAKIADHSSAPKKAENVGRKKPRPTASGKLFA